MSQEYSSIPDFTSYDPESAKMGMQAGKAFVKSK